MSAGASAAAAAAAAAAARRRLRGFAGGAGAREEPGQRQLCPCWFASSSAACRESPPRPRLPRPALFLLLPGERKVRRPEPRRGLALQPRRLALVGLPRVLLLELGGLPVLASFLGCSSSSCRCRRRRSSSSSPRPSRLLLVLIVEVIIAAVGGLQQGDLAAHDLLRLGDWLMVFFFFGNRVFRREVSAESSRRRKNEALEMSLPHLLRTRTKSLSLLSALSFLSAHSMEETIESRSLRAEKQKQVLTLRKAAVAVFIVIVALVVVASSSSLSSSSSSSSQASPLRRRSPRRPISDSRSSSSSLTLSASLSLDLWKASTSSSEGICGSKPPFCHGGHVAAAFFGHAA